MLGKIEGERRRGRKKLRWLDGITDSLDVNQGKFWEMVKGLGSLACCSPWGWEESVLGDWITTFFHYLEYKHTLFYMDTHLQIKMRIKMKRVELFLLVQISQRLTRVRGGSSVWTHLLGNRAGDVFAWMCVEWQPAENYYNKIIGLIGEKNCRDSNSRSALREENRAETTTNPQQLFFFFWWKHTARCKGSPSTWQRGPSAGPDADDCGMSLGRWWHSSELPGKKGRLLREKPFSLQPCSPIHPTS